MKKLIYIFSIAITSIIVASCSEDYLDLRPTSYITNEDLGETALIDPSIAEGNLRGIYNLMVTPYMGGTESQEDFGHKSFDLMSDLLSSDLAQVGSSYNRFVGLANYVWTADPTISIPNYTAWRFYYRIINSANLIIASNGGNDAIPESDAVKAVVGQAKTVRAFAYFYLSQYYAIQYDPSDEILPLYINPGEPGKPKSTMGEIYDQMISDLDSAIGYMEGYARPNKASINQNVAKGILAYVYASMGENVLAKQLADEVINSGEFTMMDATEVTGGFTTLGTPGWMWGFDITIANDLGLVSWHGFMDYYSYSYQAVGNYRGIDDGLYARINANDIRKQQFGAPSGGNVIAGAYPLIPVGKFYNLNKVHFGQLPITDDYVYMRVTEMYLLSAEMSAVEGDDFAARTRLKEVLSKRYSNPADYAYVDGLSGTALLEEIVFNTKIEFIGEGKSYLLMKRRKLSNTRGTNHLNRAGETISYDNPDVTFSIHQREITDNPNISEGNK
ncbi:RagB/SusD family nutrient uptake outer membrane protein [Lutibacter sp.]